MLMLRRAFLASLLLIAAIPAWAEELRGRVVAIADGDTLTLLTAERRQMRIRLHGIDAPERRQPFGTRAREALSELAFRKEVRVVVMDVDRYGRTVGRIYAGSVDVNAEMVRQGMAWVYTRYNRDPELPRLEAEAKAARRGLWRDAKPVPPWEWRRNRR
ncbi:nuclease-like protein [Acetobacteraceae bacterium AT-5844]|nr:nuclease-like protein [Acetobacteraceae bacterium AT-5844]